MVLKYLGWQLTTKEIALQKHPVKARKIRN